jgi:Cyclic nucleotide-binding domain
MSQLGHQRRFQAQAAHFRFSPDSGRIAASHRSANKSADARRGAADDGELRQAAGAAASIAADKRGVTRSQPQIHDSPRNQLNSRSIDDREARAVHVSVNKALAVCDGFSKLLKTLRQRAQGKVRQRDAGQDIYFGRRNRCMIARVDPRLPDMILASSGEEGFFVKKSRKAAFEPKTFLAKVGDGKTITGYHRDQVVFSQGSEADAVFYIQEGKIKLTVVSERGKEAVVGILEPSHFFGEGCLNGHPLRVTTATAIDQSLITRITKAAMIATLHDEPEFSELFMGIY